MRPIKFRAWDGAGMIFFDLHEGINWGVVQGGRIEPDGDFKVMQFTGLLDKNGSEIYEGDVLSDDHFQWFVEWDKRGGFTLRSGHNGLKEKDHWRRAFFQINQLGDMEIIGNIYENLELLKAS